MYKSEFDNLLKQNKAFKAYMFFGESTFLIDYYTNLVSSKLAPKDEINKLYFEEYDTKKALDILLQSSLFSDSNILVIKTQKTIPKKECQELISAVNTNPASTVLIACIGDTDFREMAKNFDAKQNGVNVRFYNPFPNEALNILKQRADELDIKYEHANVLYHLLNMHKNSLELAFNDLEKLALLNEPLTVKVIDNNCFGFGSINLDEFIVKLLLSKDISSELTYLIDEGINDVYLVNQITSFVSQLFMFNSFITINGYINSSEILGYKLPKNIEDERANLAIKFKNEDYLKMLNYLFDLELKLKSTSGIDNTNFLETGLRNFSTIF
ncbi:DNA polymerase III subunit delta [Arcobacter sp. FWKO B]|uniref:DNA polymerase III subunit delta n=1 Tax=Arcobacter sp. FWKO B TaxID=2593672 RepID=UPI0018A45CF9|nr:DNA polymerase III subunit delta [Arcobacter sp. FWKO B]QOG13079.1 DNA polymerase III subunit delta [Arcobacter sp. FWKO B]